MRNNESHCSGLSTSCQTLYITRHTPKLANIHLNERCKLHDKLLECIYTNGLVHALQAIGNMHSMSYSLVHVVKILSY